MRILDRLFGFKSLSISTLAASFLLSSSLGHAGECDEWQRTQPKPVPEITHLWAEATSGGRYLRHGYTVHDPSGRFDPLLMGVSYIFLYASLDRRVPSPNYFGSHDTGFFRGGGTQIYGPKTMTFYQDWAMFSDPSNGRHGYSWMPPGIYELRVSVQNKCDYDTPPVIKKHYFYVDSEIAPSTREDRPTPPPSDLDGPIRDQLPPGTQVQNLPPPCRTRWEHLSRTEQNLRSISRGSVIRAIANLNESLTFYEGYKVNPLRWREVFPEATIQEAEEIFGGIDKTIDSLYRRIADLRFLYKKLECVDDLRVMGPRLVHPNSRSTLDNLTAAASVKGGLVASMEGLDWFLGRIYLNPGAYTTGSTAWHNYPYLLRNLSNANIALREAGADKAYWNEVESTALGSLYVTTITTPGRIADNIYYGYVGGIDPNGRFNPGSLLQVESGIAEGAFVIGGGLSPWLEVPVAAAPAVTYVVRGSAAFGTGYFGGRALGNLEGNISNAWRPYTDEGEINPAYDRFWANAILSASMAPGMRFTPKTTTKPHYALVPYRPEKVLIPEVLGADGRIILPGAAEARAISPYTLTTDPKLPSVLTTQAGKVHLEPGDMVIEMARGADGKYFPINVIQPKALPPAPEMFSIPPVTKLLELPEASQIPIPREIVRRALLHPMGDDLRARGVGTGSDLVIGFGDQNYFVPTESIGHNLMGESIQARFVRDILKVLLPDATFADGVSLMKGRPNPIGPSPFHTEFPGKIQVILPIVDLGEMPNLGGGVINMPWVKLANGSLEVLRGSQKQLRQQFGIPTDAYVVHIYTKFPYGIGNFPDEIPSLKTLIAAIVAHQAPDVIFISESGKPSSEGLLSRVPSIGNGLYQGIFASDMSRLTDVGRTKYIVVNNTQGRVPYLDVMANVKIVEGPVNYPESMTAGVPTVYFDNDLILLGDTFGLGNAYLSSVFQQMSTVAKQTGGGFPIQNLSQLPGALEQAQKAKDITAPYRLNTPTAAPFKGFMDQLQSVFADYYEIGRTNRDQQTPRRKSGGGR